MQIYVVRHGETRSNVEGRLQGQSNDGLNEKGVRLAAVTGQGMRGIHFDECITSPLIRAADTARIILRESGNESTPVVYDDRLKEISFGIYEGKKIGVDDIQTEAMKSFLHDPMNFPGLEGGETIRQVCSRTQEFLKELAERDDGKTYLVATHGCALRCMLNTLYDHPEEFWHGRVPYNCSVNIIEAVGGKMKLLEDDKVYYDLSDTVDRYAKY